MIGLTLATVVVCTIAILFKLHTMHEDWSGKLQTIANAGQLTCTAVDTHLKSLKGARL
jgi:hypothetical protein